MHISDAQSFSGFTVAMAEGVERRCGAWTPARDAPRESLLENKNRGPNDPRLRL
jgi:hypothetical protein